MRSLVWLPILVIPACRPVDPRGTEAPVPGDDADWSWTVREPPTAGDAQDTGGDMPDTAPEDTAADCDESATWYLDADGDGFGDPFEPVTGCTAPPGTVADGTDCDDTDPSMTPAVAADGTGCRVGSLEATVQCYTVTTTEEVHADLWVAVRTDTVAGRARVELEETYNAHQYDLTFVGARAGDGVVRVESFSTLLLYEGDGAWETTTGEGDLVALAWSQRHACYSAGCDYVYVVDGSLEVGR